MLQCQLSNNCKSRCSLSANTEISSNGNRVEADKPKYEPIKKSRLSNSIQNIHLVIFYWQTCPEFVFLIWYKMHLFGQRIVTFEGPALEALTTWQLCLTISQYKMKYTSMG